MVMACSKPITVQSKDGMKFRVKIKGDEFLSWMEDTSGNPLIEDKDGTIHYATWFEKQQRFRKVGYLLKTTRQRFLKESLNRPSPQAATKFAENRRKQMDNLPPLEVKLPGKTKETSEEEKPSPAPAPGGLKRPILVIYVQFNDSTGSPVSDAYITDMITNKSKFGTLAHYYDLNLSGYPDISIIDNKIYHVTLDTNGKAYGNDFASIRAEVILPALQKVANQGFDFSKYATSGLSGNDITRETCTPLLLVHANEAAVTTGSCTIWGHAYRNGTGITMGGHALMQAQVFGAFHQGTDWFSLGIIAHESGHALFNFPDLYDTDLSDGKIEGFGSYSLMSAGSWGYTADKPKAGMCPVNLDGYNIARVDKALCKEITTSGPQQLASPYEPHLVMTPKVKGEWYILQPRCYKDYDEGLRTLLNGATKNGVLVMHRDPWADDVTSTSNMCAHIIEAHGGDQHLRINDGGNPGEETDFFGNSVTAFGDSVADPSSLILRVKTGEKPGFDVTDIKINECSGSYNVTFSENPKPPDPPNPPNPPNPPEPPKPKCACKRPRLWRTMQP